ncbi:MAG: trypsin-like peptidase domain-containing protein, partial [Gemmatimonadaceae bacterium]|nr:trypsin-like peptidase domain-containing protein [Gemmatimonadaceae bacterium]
PAGPTATVRSDPAVRPGDDVVAVGFPLAGLLADQVNVSTGSVNALAGLYNDLHLLQMSTPVQPGSSGGALFDASGNVVGVVVTKLNAKVVAEETGDIPQNVNFAVKAAVARDFLRTQGVAYRSAQSAERHSNADVGEIGRQVTVLVECWK